MSTPVINLPPTFPNGTCFATEQARANAIVSGMTSYIDGTFKSYVVAATVPGVADHDKLWFNTGAGQNRFYFWDGAAWIAPYWFDPYSAMVVGSIFLPGIEPADLAAIDNPGSAPVQVGNEDRSGPFWVEQTLLAGRFPLGKGTLQPSATAVGANVTGGADQTTLTEAQGALGSHTHPIGNQGNVDQASGLFISGPQVTIPAESMFEVLGSSGQVDQFFNQTMADLFTGDPLTNGAIPAAAVPVPTVPPYQSGVWAKRTARKYYWIP